MCFSLRSSACRGGVGGSGEGLRRFGVHSGSRGPSWAFAVQGVFEASNLRRKPGTLSPQPDTKRPEEPKTPQAQMLELLHDESEALIPRPPGSPQNRKTPKPQTPSIPKSPKILEPLERALGAGFVASKIPGRLEAAWPISPQSQSLLVKAILAGFKV